ncbi:DUF3024 domain-containing protein [Nafulsella turpanensis]|uniref:DUF3024 domain-containing protein n=1 Tax=Nafulsella turpanensis TaxID=1265690 RepID=UPI00034D9CFC|nr:DUF3024 domain-containing protein [Nafulsella turpanensis]
MIDLVERQIQKFIESKRPSEEIRSKLDFGYSYKNNAVELYEIRPQWDDESIIRHHPFAKAKYVKTKNIWKVYWMRSNLKWALYDPLPEVKGVDEFLEAVDQDAHHCFFG